MLYEIIHRDQTSSHGQVLGDSGEGRLPLVFSPL